VFYCRLASMLLKTTCVGHARCMTTWVLRKAP